MLALFAHYFGIRPWEVDLLTHQQFCDLEAEAHRMNEAARKAAQEGG